MKELSIMDIQGIALEIMIEFDAFCRQHGLTYCLAWGTLIGAVRHKGFIPWDDDIDVFMPRPDFERFRKEYQDHERFKLYATTRQKDYFYSHMKLCDNKTYQILPTGAVDSRGVDIDIFALDGQPDDEKRGEKEYKVTHRLFYQFIIQPNRWRYLQPISFVNRIRISIIDFLVKTGIRNKVSQMIDYQFSKRDFNSANRIGATHSCYYKGYYSWDKKVFDEMIEGELESKHFFIPKNYDLVLKKIYGDYMVLPPIEKRITTHQEKYYIKSE